jgi:dynein heavy chain 1, cytosolic
MRYLLERASKCKIKWVLSIKDLSLTPASLRSNIITEDRIVAEKVSSLISTWNSEKPVAGNTPPEDALASLVNFESRFRNAEVEYDTVAKAKEALDLPQSEPNPVLPLLEELQDFKSVWTALSKIWDSLQDLRDTVWTSVAPRKVRQSLDGLVAITKDMPSRMRQYSAFEYVQGVLQKLIKINPLLSELKSDAIKERHWTKIFKVCRSRERFLPSALNLGTIWDLDLSANETGLREVIQQAQGEMALEEYLRQVNSILRTSSNSCRSGKPGQITYSTSSTTKTNVVS